MSFESTGAETSSGRGGVNPCAPNTCMIVEDQALIGLALQVHLTGSAPLVAIPAGSKFLVRQQTGCGCKVFLRGPRLQTLPSGAVHPREMPQSRRCRSLVSTGPADQECLGGPHRSRRAAVART
jgi:hypothetical protein